MIKVVLASHNPGKIREFQQILANFSLALIPLLEIDQNQIAETGTTFIENAIIKARKASELTGLPALADDSGLCVTALNGAPGIFSARYAGENASAHDNIRKLLAELADVPEHNRTAHFHCVIAFMLNASDPNPLICEGTWQGNILMAPQGQHGFGYDPIFFDPAYQKSAAELPKEIKNTISHRAKALQLLMKQLPEKLCMLSPSKI